MRPTALVGSIRPATRAGALALAVAAAALVGAQSAATAASAVPTARLATASGDLGGWRTVAGGPKASAAFESRPSRTRSLRLADPLGRGFAAVTAGFGGRSKVTVSVRLRALRMRLGLGTVRPLLWVGSSTGHSQQAGVIRTRRGVRWALWRVKPGGARVGWALSGVRLPAGSWRNVSLTTTWSGRRARATLRMNGRIIARTRPTDLRRARANRVSVGLGRARGRNAGAVLLLRSAVVGPAGRVAPVAPVKPSPLSAEDHPYAPAFAFNEPIPEGTPSDPRSDAIVSQVVENAANSKVMVSADGEVPPVYLARPSDPLYSVNVGGKRTRFRVPPNAVAGGGSDSPLVILDPSHPDFGRDVELRLWQASIGSGSISASGSGLFHYNNDGARLNPDGSQSISVPFAGGGTGSGLSILAGLIRPDQVRSGFIRHALRFAYSARDFSSRFRAPAIRSDQPKGTSTRNTATAMDMGMRLQLDPAVNCDARTVPGAAAGSPQERFLRMICHALQDYGMIAVDGTGDRGLLLMMENSVTADWPSVVGPEVNNSYGYIVRDKSSPSDGTARDDRSGIPWNRLRVLAKSDF